MFRVARRLGASLFGWSRRVSAGQGQGVGFMAGKRSTRPGARRLPGCSSLFPCMTDLPAVRTGPRRQSLILPRALGYRARVELAERDGRPGAIPANLRPGSCDLFHGQLFMQVREVQGYVPGYVPGRPGHSLENIRLLANWLNIMPDWHLRCRCDTSRAATGPARNYLTLE